MSVRFCEECREVLDLVQVDSEGDVYECFNGHIEVVR